MTQNTMWYFDFKAINRIRETRKQTQKAVRNERCVIACKDTCSSAIL